MFEGIFLIEYTLDHFHNPFAVQGRFLAPGVWGVSGAAVRQPGVLWKQRCRRHLQDHETEWLGFYKGFRVLGFRSLGFRVLEAIKDRVTS